MSILLTMFALSTGISEAPLVEGGGAPYVACRETARLRLACFPNRTATPMTARKKPKLTARGPHSRKTWTARPEIARRVHPLCFFKPWAGRGIALNPPADP
jgi:hypothetical protein